MFRAPVAKLMSALCEWIRRLTWQSPWSFVPSTRHNTLKLFSTLTFSRTDDFSHGTSNVKPVRYCFLPCCSYRTCFWSCMVHSWVCSPWLPKCKAQSDPEQLNATQLFVVCCLNEYGLSMTIRSQADTRLRAWLLQRPWRHAYIFSETVGRMSAEKAIRVFHSTRYVKSSAFHGGSHRLLMTWVLVKVVASWGVFFLHSLTSTFWTFPFPKKSNFNWRDLHSRSTFGSILKGKTAGKEIQIMLVSSALPCRFREWMLSLTMGQGFWMFSVGVFVHRSSTLVLWLPRCFPFVRTKETVWRDYVGTSGSSSMCESAISQLLDTLQPADCRGGYQHPHSQSKRDYFVHAERRSKHDNSRPWAWNCCATAWDFEATYLSTIQIEGEWRCIWRYQNQSVTLWGSQTVLAGTSFPSLIWVTLPLGSLTRARLVACWALASCLALRPDDLSHPSFYDYYAEYNDV